MTDDDVQTRLASLEAQVAEALVSLGRIAAAVDRIWKWQTQALGEAQGPFAKAGDLATFIVAHDLGSAELARGAWSELSSSQLRRILEESGMPPLEVDGKTISIKSLRRIRTQVVGEGLFTFSTPRRRKAFTAWIDSL
jgi:hypothetical protein